MKLPIGCQGQKDKLIQNMKENDWPTEIKLSHSYNACCAKFLSLLLIFQQIWNGHLGRLEPDEHQIELNIAQERPVHSGPYRAGLRVLEFKKHGIYKMPAMGVVE